MAIKNRELNKNTDNQIKNTKTKFFDTFFVLNFQEPNLGKLGTITQESNLPKYAEFECSYIINSTILIYYIFYMWYSTHIIL